MRITLNGRETEVSCTSAFELRDRLFSQDCIVILNGFQISENMNLSDGDNVSIIRKGVMPDREQLESLMAARHTPKVHEKVKKARVAVCGLG